jgi:hypothetical protein
MPDVPGARVKHEHVVGGQDQVRQANREVAASFDQVKGGIDKFSANAVIAANQALELAGKMVELAKSVGEVVKAGGAVDGVNRAFEAMGGAAPSIQALQSAVAGVVSENNLKGFAVFAEGMNLSAEEALNLSRRVTFLAERQGKLEEVGELLNKASGDGVGLFKELGVTIDETMVRYQGLTEAEKNLKIAQDQARLGSQAQVDALKSSSVAVLGLSARLQNMKDSAASAFSEWLAGSGILEAVGEVMQDVSDWAAENEDRLRDIADTVKGVLVKSLDLASAAARGLLVAVEALGPGIEAVLEGIAAIEDSDLFRASLGRIIESERLRAEIIDRQMEMRAGDGKLLEGIQKDVDRILEAEQQRGEAIEKAVSGQSEMRDLMKSLGGHTNIMAKNFVELHGGIDGAVSRLEETDFGAERVAEIRGELEAGLVAINDQREANEHLTLGVFERAQLNDELQAQEDAILVSLREIVGVENTLLQAQWAQNEAITVQKDLIAESLEAEKAAEKRREESRRKRKAAREEAKRDLAEFDELLTELMIDEESSAAAALIAEDAAKAHMFRVGFGLGTDLRAGFKAFFEEEEELPPIFQGIEATAAATENLAERNAILAGSFSAVASSMSELDFASDSFLGKAGQVSDSMSMMVKGLDQAGDSTASAVAAVAGASAEMAGSVFESTTAQAALLALFYGGQGWALLPNVAAATPKFVASATMATAAAMSFAGVGGKSSSGGSAGAGAGAGVDSSGFSPSLATEQTQTEQAPGTTVILQFTDVTGTAANRMADVLNEGARNGTGIRLDPELLEGLS